MKKNRENSIFWNEQHKTVASTPMVWFMDSEQLRRSYKILADSANQSFDPKEHHYSSLPASLMLAGYALENIFKGLLVMNDEDQPFDSKGSFKYKSHNLVELATDANISLDDNEKELLEILGYYTVTGGRYPISLFSDDMMPREFIDGTIAPIGIQRYSHTNNTFLVYEKVDMFFEKLGGYYELPMQQIQGTQP